jgi:hypothetical protein
MKAKNTGEEIDHPALAQAKRIDAYLPILEERERRFVRELEELRRLIADERAALDDLLHQAHGEGKPREGRRPKSA